VLNTELAALLRSVGARLLECRAPAEVRGEWHGTQFKADADLMVDDLLRSALPSIADLPIISEEDVASQTARRPREYWLIDPIDGTASFAQGFDGFVCQVALMRDNRPQLSGVYAPARDRLYMAAAGNGATLNDAPLSVSASAGPVRLVDNYPQPRGIAQRLVRDLGASYVESGSIGLKICLVADGTADLFVKDVAVRDWDVAAPHLVLQEAGGCLTKYDGEVFEYEGSYAKHGLIAARSAAVLGEVGVRLQSYQPRCE
jgi:3'(2'), 5'-bisphosphate nucleotidase